MDVNTADGHVPEGAAPAADEVGDDPGDRERDHESEQHPEDGRRVRDHGLSPGRGADGPPQPHRPHDDDDAEHDGVRPDQPQPA